MRRRQLSRLDEVHPSFHADHDAANYVGKLGVFGIDRGRPDCSAGKLREINASIVVKLQSNSEGYGRLILARRRNSFRLEAKSPTKFSGGHNAVIILVQVSP